MAELYNSIIDPEELAIVLNNNKKRNKTLVEQLGDELRDELHNSFISLEDSLSGELDLHDINTPPRTPPQTPPQTPSSTSTDSINTLNIDNCTDEYAASRVYDTLSRIINKLQTTNAILKRRIKKNEEEIALLKRVIFSKYYQKQETRIFNQTSIENNIKQLQRRITLLRGVLLGVINKRLDAAGIP